MRCTAILSVLFSVGVASVVHARSVDVAHWGLDRIDQRPLTRDNNFSVSATGAGVFVYVVDQGINRIHADFTGPYAGWGTTQSCSGNPTTATQGCYQLSGNYDPAQGGGARYDNNTVSDDCTSFGNEKLGHGSHVAGIVGSATHGVAPGVTIVPVRVLDCFGQGDVNDIFAAFDWIEKKQATRTGSKPAVVTMSLGLSANCCPGDPTLIPDLQAAIQSKLIDKGVVVVAAAGNAATDACTIYPAAIPDVISVAASDAYDAEAGYSDYGTCVDIVAPGTDIMSVGARTSTATAVKSGTSMAAPFVAGAAALLLEANPTATPAAVWNAMKLNATTCVIARANASRASQTPNRLIHTGSAAAPPCAPSAASATLSGTSVSVSWTSPLDGNGAPVTSYTATASGGVTPLTCTASQPTTTCTIAGLAAGVTYAVSVSATSTGGTSAAVGAGSVSVPALPISLSVTTLKVKKSITLKALVKSVSTGKRTYKRVSGSCRLTTTRLYAPTKKGTCKIKVSIAKTATQAAISKTLTIRII